MCINNNNNNNEVISSNYGMLRDHVLLIKIPMSMQRNNLGMCPQKGFASPVLEYTLGTEKGEEI